MRILDSALLSIFWLIPTFAWAAPLTGQLIVDAQHPAWFKFQGGGPFFMSGPGDPEGFLYRGTRNADGTRNGDQTTLIDKLEGTGANCIYLMAVRSHGGDGDATQNPFNGNDPNQALNSAILNQWESWFTAMDGSGIVTFFILYDDSASPYGKNLPAGGQLKPQEAAFIDAIVARFKHHLNWIWCVAEEYGEGLSPAHAAKIGERIRQQDDLQHPIAIHQNNSTAFDFNGNPDFNQFAVQWNVDTAAQLHAGAVAAWTNVGGQINVNMSEFADAGTGAVLRQKVWALALGGAYSMILDMDIASTAMEDLQTCGRLVQFMQATRFNQASPHDELAGANADYVLADPGEMYIAYGDAGTSIGMSITGGRYHVRWYDPIAGVWSDGGRPVLSAGVQNFTKPPGFGPESAICLELIPLAVDTDADGDVDQVDFGRFQTCLTKLGALSVPAACLFADLNQDGAVDQTDFGFFLGCLSGPNVPADPGCAP